jgi:hypothetical protein
MGRTLLVDQIDEGRFVLILELFRLEATSLLVDDVSREIEHVLGDFDVLDIVEILPRIAHLVRIAQQRPIRPLSSGSSAMMCSRFVSTTRPIATFFISRMVSRITAKASWPTLPSGRR